MLEAKVTDFHHKLRGEIKRNLQMDEASNNSQFGFRIRIKMKMRMKKKLLRFCNICCLFMNNQGSNSHLIRRKKKMGHSWAQMKSLFQQERYSNTEYYQCGVCYILSLVNIHVCLR